MQTSRRRCDHGWTLCAGPCLRALIVSVGFAISALACHSRESAGESAGTPAAVAPSAQLGSARQALLSTTTLPMTGDTYLESGSPNQNHGDDLRLSLQAPGRHRTLLFIGASEITGAVGNGTLVSAQVELNLQATGSNWGASGRSIAIHRLERASDEGHATWNCALDADVDNQQDDCSGASAWSMGTADPAQQPWRSPATATALITNGQTGVVRFDVTADVAAVLAGSAAGHGWLLKKVEETLNGSLEFASREQGSGPRLLLELEDGPGPGNCTATGPVDTSCNGEDDDCDGQIDEDFSTTTTTCGIGACTATGATSCVAGHVEDSCLPGAPAPNDGVCNLIDDDCNGIVDEDYIGLPTSCGVGACFSDGITECVLGQALDSCRPEAPAASDASCDLVDDDCDGSSDEDFAGAVTTCGVGACAALGVTRCASGQVQDTCAPGAPAAADPTCDLVDDDCDGIIDEDFASLPTSCGVGACSASGSTSCVLGSVLDGCTPGSPAASDPSCDGTDDDCDGASDEDFVPVCTGSSIESCSGGSLAHGECSDGNVCNGQEICAGAPGAPVCAGQSPPPVDDGNPCTLDACDATLGVTHLPAPDGTACADGNLCNGAEACDGAGSCAAGEPPALDDEDVCTLDLCDAAEGVTHPPAPAGTPCEEGEFCNGQDVCDGAGECLATGLPEEDDVDACTFSYCDPIAGESTVVCSPIDPVVASTVGSDFEFLYVGASAPQAGVAAGVIDPVRAALIRGQVSDTSGTGLSNVSVAALGHPEFGSTLSRVDGSFDFVVNGGQAVTLTYRMDGYLDAQRQVSVRWGDYAHAADVVLLGPDLAVTTVSPNAPSFQLARGSLMTDGEGARRATLLFPPGTTAQLLLPDGSTLSPSELHVRATEYTVGALGDEALPAESPASSGYTYAVELSADEALDAGATEVSFNQPIAFYVENFLGMPVGTLVPTGYYDRGLGRWIPSNNGRVVRIVSITNGVANLDADGNGSADSDAVLAALGISVNERRQLPALYAAGAALWRVSISRLAPWNHAFPFGPAVASCAPSSSCGGTPDPSGPARVPDPCEERAASSIECENQVLLQSIPVAGTPFSLVYSSDRAVGFHAGDTLEIPITGGSALPANAVRTEVVVDIAGRRFSETHTTATNQTQTFRWDGLDFAQRRLQGVQTATVRRGYVYQPVYMQPQPFAQAFAQLSGVPLANPGRRELTLWNVTEHDLGGWRAADPGLGGWAISHHHAYDPRRHVVLRGDGREEDPGYIYGQSIAREAGTGSRGAGTDGPNANGSALSFPAGVAVGADGSVYVADTQNQRIRRVSSDGSVTTIVGDGIFPNLVFNGSNEQPTPVENQIQGWTAVSGDWSSRSASPNPFDGNQYFFAGVAALAELRQDVDVTEFSASIDAGQQSFSFEGYVNSFPQTLIDATQIVVEYRDAANTAVLSSFDTGVIRQADNWLRQADTRIAPVGTRRIRVRLIATRAQGGNNDGYFDAISLRAGTANTASVLNSPRGLAFGPDGALYVADTNRNRVRRIEPTGQMTTVAGAGTAGFAGDNGPATAALLSRPSAVAVAADGAVYIADTGNSRIRSVSPSGIITTLTGTGTSSSTGNGGRAGLATIASPEALAVLPDGTLLLAERTTHRIRSIRPDGIVRAFAGTGTAGFAGDGGPASSAQLSNPSGLGVSRDGNVFIADTGNHRIRVVTPAGLIFTLSGTGMPSASGDGGPALAAGLNGPTQLAVGPDGALHVADTGNHEVRRVAPVLPPLSSTELLVAASNGDEIYRFTGDGRHLQTLRSVNGAPLFEFGYDAQQRLTSISDESGLVTELERNGGGRVVAILGPYGQRTTLGVDAAGNLQHVTNPEGEAYQLTYSSEGLLTSFTDPRGGVSRLSYDALGRLTRHEDALSAATTLNRTESATSFTVRRSTPLGRTTSYETARTADDSKLRTTTLPDGSAQTSLQRRNGTATSSAPDRTLTSSVDRPDPRWGIAAAVTSQTKRLPSGLERVTTRTREASLRDPEDPFSLSTLTDTTNVNGRVYRSVFDAATSSYLLTSPAGRRTFRVVDEVGRTLRLQVDGLSAIDFLYDADGQLLQTLQGERATSYDYFASGPANGYLQDITNALGETTQASRDALGRVLSSTRGGTTTSYVWDRAGNLVRLTPPGQPEHAMTYTPVDLLASYDPPSVDGNDASTAYEYDADRALSSELRPSGVEIQLAYDAAGRVFRRTAPSGVIESQYYAAGASGPGQAPGRLAQLLGPGNIALAYGYDGELPTTEALSGDVTALVRWDYDANLAVVRQTVTAPGVSRATSFGYDADLLVTCASPTTCTPLGASALVLTRDPRHGLVTLLSQGALGEARSYDALGELSSQVLRSGTTDLLRFEYAGAAAPRDGLGRILHQAEVSAGTTRQLEFSYDVSGRLTDVSVDAELSEHYEYDANGNRLLGQTPAGTAPGVYDAQDRLLSYGGDTYVYSADGDLLTKTTASGEVTSYDYDAFGNLLGVALPDGRDLQYVVDGRGRRIGKKVDGVLTRRWVYGSQLQPIAELDGAGNLLSSFVYASRGDVPDYLQRANGAVYRIVSDQLGSVRLVVNVSNANDVLWRADYSAFGELTLQQGNAAALPFGFASGLYDPDTELVRFGGRDYDPVVGRWTSKDPVLWRGQETNRYAYQGNDPVNRRAPTDAAVRAP